MPTTDERIIEQLQAKVDAVRTKACAVCQAAICGHEILFSVALGLADKPRCAKCLATGMGRPTNLLRDHLRNHFRRRECYGEVWRRESEREGFAQAVLPGCLWPNGETSEQPIAPAELVDDIETLDEPDVIGLAGAEWDAGEMACGDLILMLRRRMNDLSPGTILKLTAQDSGATEDIPAWCRMTGHTLLTQQHPHYWIQRKE